MQLSVLASGSRGNCTFISTKESNILIDAGISEKRIKKSLSELGIEISQINAVLITHEHVDHVNGLEKIMRHDIPIFMRPATYAAYGQKLQNINYFDSLFHINEISIKTINTSHDAADPVGFMIKGKKTASVITDTGKYDAKIADAVNSSDALVLEANHDIDMLLNGNYSYHLKERILGPKGHLSNIDSGLLVQKHASEKLKNVFLAHLSQNNNTPELALNTFTKLTEKQKINTMLTNQSIMSDFIKI